MTSKVQPAAFIEPLTEKTWGKGCVIWRLKNKEQNGEIPLRKWKYSAFVGYEEFCRFWRVLSTSAFGFCE